MDFYSRFQLQWFCIRLFYYSNHSLSTAWNTTIVVFFLVVHCCDVFQNWMLQHFNYHMWLATLFFCTSSVSVPGQPYVNERQIEGVQASVWIFSDNNRPMMTLINIPIVSMCCTQFSVKSQITESKFWPSFAELTALLTYVPLAYWIEICQQQTNSLNW